MMKFSYLFSIVAVISCNVSSISTAQIPAPALNRQGPDGGLLTKKEVSLRNVHYDRLDFKYSTDGGRTWKEVGLVKNDQLSIPLRVKDNNVIPLQLQDADRACPAVEAVQGGNEAQIHYQNTCLVVARLINRS